MHQTVYFHYASFIGRHIALIFDMFCLQIGGEFPLVCCIRNVFMSQLNMLIKVNFVLFLYYMIFVRKKAFNFTGGT